MTPPSDSEESLLYAKHVYSKYSPRRRYLFVVSSLTGLSLIGLVIFSLWTQQPGWKSNSSSTVPQDSSDVLLEAPGNSALDPLDPLAFVNGPATLDFHDNMKPGVKYVTSWPAAGWTNDVMTYANLIYLGLITDRVPVIPMFTPSHIGGSVPPIPFGDVFDMHRLRQLLGKPVLEWRDIKDPQSESIDDLGCWNTWQAVQYHEARPRYSVAPLHLKLDLSYTTAPEWIKLIPKFEHDQHVTFWSLARFAFPDTRNANLVTPLPSPIHNVSLPPDEQMLCYDYLYYVCAQQPYEYDSDYSPAWRYAAQYMRWTPSLEALANEYIRTAVGFDEDETTPPYIGIHVRHSDFVNYCNDLPLTDCFAPIPVIARRVKEVQDEILEKKGIMVTHVIMTSDERNETWWQEVAQQGWFTPDHEKTKELYGDWYPLLIDAVIQSGGIGFVGTDRSTMSILARRRVEAWHGGITRTVLWGHVGADDH